MHHDFNKYLIMKNKKTPMDLLKEFAPEFAKHVPSSANRSRNQYFAYLQVFKFKEKQVRLHVLELLFYCLSLHLLI